ncbi:MAG: DUF805 domain-containing protein [Pseudomonadota bacterium]
MSDTPHGQMGVGAILFSPNGRIAPSQFWAAWTGLLAANVVFSFIPLISNIMTFVLIYIGVCIYGKRLHDSGKSAWVHIIPWIVTLIIIVGVTVQNYDAVVALVELGESGRQPTEEEALDLFNRLGAFFLAILIYLGIWLAYTVWVGTRPSQKFDNRYGKGPSGDVF